MISNKRKPASSDAAFAITSMPTYGLEEIDFINEVPIFAAKPFAT